VFVVDKDNVVHSREITIEAEMPDLYIVKSGVNANEKILLEGIRKVKDNDKIEFAYEKPEDVLPKLKVYVE
jgi:membrane fusion protein (multidrug efflux system)